LLGRFLIVFEFIVSGYIPFEQVVSSSPPSNQIGIKSVQREAEEIVPMKSMKMEWYRYTPLGKRYANVQGSF